MYDEEVGEVIGSSNTEFIAESTLLHQSPPFGSFIKVKAREPIYGVVFNAYTHSLEPNRLAIAYHRSEQELRDEQPQIFELLKTKFEAVIIGYESNGSIRHYLPPQPPRLHSFVYVCHPMEVRRLTARFWFLRFLLSVEKAPRDELIAAAIRAAYAVRQGERSFLVQAGKALVKLIGDDYEMLASILHRIQES
ncbi:MAG: hypothetical protein KatS3mg131_0041 [Candidatus Tectimicrobiota bacterium]|nr:MAG: hypothetical protein KatS3mg131_0041 [Candidatus Tectomicrobia bacterium]